MSEVRAAVVEILGTNYGIPPDAVKDDTSFDALDIDALESIELTMLIEEKFEVEIPDEKIEGVNTVADYVRVVETAIQEKG